MKNKKVARTGNSGSAKYFNRVVGLNGNAARLSFYNPVGIDVPNEFFYKNIVTAVPGVMRIGFVPGPGYSKDSVSAVNVASFGITAYLTNNIGRPQRYDPQDYMQYILAFHSAVLHLAKLGRALGICQLTSGENRYIPETLLQAMGFEVSLRQEQPNGRWLFNYYANQLTKFSIPNTFTNINWQLKLLSNVFRDQDNLKAQLYVLDSDVYYVYDEATGVLEAKAYDYTNGTSIISSNLMSLNKWRTIMDQILSPMLQSQDMGYMSSDTKKAFGDALFTVPKISVDYITDIVKDPEILNFIHNLTLCGVAATSTPSGLDHFLNLSNFDISQDPSTSALLWEPEIRIPNYAQVANNITSYFTSTLAIDMPNDNPSEDEVLVATRGKAEVGTVSSGGVVKVICAGTEVYTTAIVIQLDSTGTYRYWPAGHTETIPNSLLTAAMTNLTALSVFDWSPKLAYALVDSSTYAFVAAIQLWEINNYTMLNHDILTRINDGAMASVYNIPEIGILK